MEIKLNKEQRYINAFHKKNREDLLKEAKYLSNPPLSLEEALLQEKQRTKETTVKRMI